MKISIYNDRKIEEIKDDLGWWEHGESDSFSTLVSVCMILCDRIAELETKIKSMDKALYQAANTASCLANGILPN